MLFFVFFNTPLWTWSSAGPNVVTGYYAGLGGTCSLQATTPARDPVPIFGRSSATKAVGRFVDRFDAMLPCRTASQMEQSIAYQSKGSESRRAILLGPCLLPARARTLGALLATCFEVFSISHCGSGPQQALM